MPGSFAASHQREKIGFMDHLYNADACSEISVEGKRYFFLKLIDLEALLRADGKVGLVLIEADENDLVFLLLHYYYQLEVVKKRIIQELVNSPKEITTHSILVFIIRLLLGFNLQ